MNLNYLLSAFVSAALHGFAGVLFIPFNKISSVEAPVTIEVLWEKSTASPLIVPREAMSKSSQKNKPEIQRTALKQKAGGRYFGIRAERREEPIQDVPQGFRQEGYKRKAYHPLPQYPWISRKRGEEGSVSFIVKTDAEGRVTEMKLAKSSGYKRLDEAAQEGIQSWVLSEANCQKSLTITFQLKDETFIKFK